MKKSVADLKAQLDYAKSKIKMFDDRLQEMSNEYDCEQREMWVIKMSQLEHELDESMKILEE